MPPQHHSCFMTIRHNCRSSLLVPHHRYISRNIPAVIAASRMFPQHPSLPTRMIHCSKKKSHGFKEYSWSSCIIIVGSWAFVIIDQHESSYHTIDRYQTSFPLLLQHYCCFLSIHYQWRAWFIIPHHRSLSSIIPEAPQNYCFLLTIRHNWRSWFSIPEHVFISSIIPSILGALHIFPQHPSSTTRMNRCSQK